MIATGGLLRITARRQDPLSTTRTAHKTKKSKEKSRTEVVVKARLKLMSVAGLVASLGLLVLLVGMVMAALGYWPRDGLFFKTATPEGGSAPGAAGTQKPEAWSQPEEDGGGVNGTGRQHGPGFLRELLYRCLHSERLKVLGPLIMGIGIFLFICGNAVLHENRDKKTKVINLRDIYSTVIDLHSQHRPSSASPGPLNGLVNYVQSKGLESKPRYCPPLLKNRGEGGGGQQPEPGSSQGGVGGDGEAGVASIYRYTPPAPAPSPGPPSARWTSMFTCSPAPWRRHSAGEGETSGRGGRGAVQNQEVACLPPPGCSSTPTPSVTSCSFSSLHLEAPGGSRALLLLSSPSSLTPHRRGSLPTTTAAETQPSHHTTSLL